MIPRKSNLEFKEIYINYYESILAFVKNRINNEQDSFDLVQDVFLKVHAGLSKLKEKEKLKAWIFQVTRNTIADYFQQKSKKQASDHNESKEYNCSENVEDESKKLIPIIKSLPPIYRDALFFSEIYGFPNKEVAELLNISLSATKSRILRGKKLLYHKMHECCQFKVDKYGNMVECHEKPAYTEIKKLYVEK